MDLLPAAIAALIVVIALAWWLRRRRGGGDKLTERLDTLIAWPPERTRVLSSAERKAYQVLVRALPEHMILAQVPLARFLRVPTRYSYSEWLRRLGYQCADFVVCDSAAEVLAVVSVQASATQESERGRKRRLRMAKVLKVAGIPLHVWTADALPSPEAAREVLQPTQGTSSPAADVRTAGPAPLSAIPVADEALEVREPTPSTWFDEFNSSPAPLQDDKPRPR